jgi:hypothetical protein
MLMISTKKIKAMANAKEPIFRIMRFYPKAIFKATQHIKGTIYPMKKPLLLS